jgi:hypothetical protein
LDDRALMFDAFGAIGDLHLEHVDLGCCVHAPPSPRYWRFPLRGTRGEDG